LHILVKKTSGFKDIMGNFGMKKSTLSFHLKKLVDGGLLVEGRRERNKTYSVADPETLARVLVTYRRSFLDEAVDRFVETWESL
jgi:DNA-binding transcriptional ArsR family regulator